MATGIPLPSLASPARCGHIVSSTFLHRRSPYLVDALSVPSVYVELTIDLLLGASRLPESDLLLIDHHAMIPDV